MPSFLSEPHRLPIVRFRFFLEASDPLFLQSYPGSAWRGLLGHGLKRTVCVTHQPTCDGCLLQGSCVYSTLFESPAIDGQTRERYNAIPHPFVLELEPPFARSIEPGESATVGINLFGSSNSAVPYLINALNVAGRRGHGNNRGEFLVRAVEQEKTLGTEDWCPVYTKESGRYTPVKRLGAQLPEPPEAAQVELKTPLRIKQRGRLMGPRDFDLKAFLKHLAWRFEAIHRFYHDRDGAVTRHEPVRVPLEGVCLDRANLRWYDWTRYSSRQRTTMQMGGLIGDLTISGPGLPQAWPLLWAGQWLHVGKASSMGLGCYRFRDPATLPERRKSVA